jgi:hypothetical protein
MVSRPAGYRWSSYAERAGRREVLSWLGSEPSFEGLGDTREVRGGWYAEFAWTAILPGEWEPIRSAPQWGQLTGKARFVNEVGAIIG